MTLTLKYFVSLFSFMKQCYVNRVGFLFGFISVFPVLQFFGFVKIETIKKTYVI